jgi:hypothetical protein
MEKISLDQIFREYAGRVEKFEIINSEGPILTIQLAGGALIFNFQEEKTNVVSDSQTVLSFLKGELTVTSPGGKSFNISPEGEWKGMIQKGAEDLLGILEK